MLSNKSDRHRGRGRPQARGDEETHGLIIRAARQEFLTHGYANTGMVAVAQKAGISTKTLYRLVPDKAELFKSVVSERIGRVMLEIDEPVAGPHDLAAALVPEAGVGSSLAQENWRPALRFRAPPLLEVFGGIE